MGEAELSGVDETLEACPVGKIRLRRVRPGLEGWDQTTGI